MTIETSGVLVIRLSSGVGVALVGPLEGDSPCVWLVATYVKVRRNHRIVSVAAVNAVGINAAGRREVLGTDIGPSEAETLWTEFSRKLRGRGLRGVNSPVTKSLF